MFDCHYDLLTYIYMNKSSLKKVKKYCEKIFEDNINGGIFNLFYMNPIEMKEELKIESKEINIIQNLKIVNNLIKENKLMLKHIKYIYGIEGLDYLEEIEDIDKIYDLGVRSVNIVWNNDNKFGGGARGNKDKGLTTLGEKLVKKLVDKKIAIDLSHANERTFKDIINRCIDLKQKGKNPIIFASHSNVRELCDVPRNLTNEQILKIKELDGVVGIVGVKLFCIKEERVNNDKMKYYKTYVKHIKYVKDLLGGVDNIAVSTDDMSYYGTKYYKKFNVFKQENVKQELEKLLWNNDFSREEIEKILYRNFEYKILQRL